MLILKQMGISLLIYSMCFCIPTVDDTVVAIPYGSRQIRLMLKGPDHLCK